jgi:beta-xylosidase
MRYQNPIILQDFSDPDVIKHKNTYYINQKDWISVRSVQP